MDQKKVWSGSKQEKTFTDLEEGPHQIKVIAFNDGKVTDISKIKVSTVPSVVRKRNEKNPVAHISVDSVVLKNQIRLSWSHPIPDDNQQYEVYRNEEKIGEATQQYFVDTNIKPNQEYNYEIIGKKKIDRETQKKNQEQMAQVEKKYKIKLKPEDKEAMNYRTYTVGTTVNSLSTDIETKTQATEYRPGYIVRYMTFIPTAYADNPLAGTGVAKFGGDNRGFSWSSNKYRTRSDIYAIFYDSGHTSFYDAPDVGRTTYYDSKGFLGGSDWASVDGIYPHNITKTSSYVSYSMEHSVGNPFDPGYPNIDYEYNATIYKSGSLSIDGNHDQAPNHEIYIMTYPGDTISTVHRHSIVSFLHLFLPLPNCYFNYTL